jgi:hypothetical protein
VQEPATDKDLSISSPGVLAASLLESACTSALKYSDSLQLEVVRDLAKDLNLFLEETFHQNDREAPPSDLLAEVALRCADLANLAACNISHLPEKQRPEAIACVHLAAGAVKALDALAAAAETGTPDASNLSRDIRSARWRVDLAVRQTEGLTATP